MLTDAERDTALTLMRDGHNVVIVTPSLEQGPVLEQLAAQATPAERTNRSHGREALRGVGVIRVCSTRSIRNGAGRGLTLDAVIVLDETACDDQAVLDTVMPSLIVSAGRLVCRAHGAH